MRALVVESFGAEPTVQEVPDPRPGPRDAVVRVRATGLCRSDWHAWVGHDPDVRLPHVPGHEYAGVVERVGADVARWRPGDRVTVPFVCACGRCPSCLAGDHQVCERQTQPGFDAPGSFAQRVRVAQADVNLVRLPDGLGFEAAAGLGCRVATAFRAVTAQGGVRPGQEVVVVGCGGVGLSAVAVAVAAGARVVAVDVAPAALELAAALGAAAGVDASTTDDVAGAVRDLTGGGAHVSLDALGSPATAATAVRSLRRRGRHVQVGLLAPGADLAGFPLDLVVARELEVVGSHGMAAHAYGPLLGLVTSGRLPADRLVTRRLPLEEGGAALAAMSHGSPVGVTVLLP